MNERIHKPLDINERIVKIIGDLIMNLNFKNISLAVFICALAVGCSFSASAGSSLEDEAEDLIEGKLAERESLGEVSASCNKPSNEDMGTVFNCTSETDIGTVDWVTEITGENKISINSVNLVTIKALDEIEQNAGTSFGNGALDCGESPIALDDSKTFACSLTRSNSEAAEDVEVKITNIETGEFRLLFETSLVEDETNDLATISTASTRKLAEELIEGEIAEQQSFTEVSANCDTPADTNLGTTFICRSQTDVGAVEWIAKITGENTISVNSVDLVTVDALRAIEQNAVEILESRSGTVLGDGALDCGDTPIALSISDTFKCELSPSNSGLIYDTEIQITDAATGKFLINVDSEPR